MADSETFKQKIAFLQNHILVPRDVTELISDQDLPLDTESLLLHTSKTLRNNAFNKILIDFSYDIVNIILDEERRKAEEIGNISPQDKQAIIALLKDKPFTLFIRANNNLSVEETGVLFKATHCALHNLPVNDDIFKRINTLLHSITLPRHCDFQNRSLNRYAEISRLIRECKQSLQRSTSRSQTKLSQASKNNVDSTADPRKGKEVFTIEVDDTEETAEETTGPRRKAFDGSELSFDTLLSDAANEDGEVQAQNVQSPGIDGYFSRFFGRQILIAVGVVIVGVALFFYYPALKHYFEGPAKESSGEQTAKTDGKNSTDTSTAKTGNTAIAVTKTETSMLTEEQPAAGSLSSNTSKPPVKLSQQSLTRTEVFRTNPNLLPLQAIEKLLREHNVSVVEETQCPENYRNVHIRQFDSMERYCVKDQQAHLLCRKDLTDYAGLTVSNYHYVLENDKLVLKNVTAETYQF